MPTAVEDAEFGDGSVQPPPTGDKGQQGLKVNPGPPNSEPGPPNVGVQPGPPNAGVAPGPPDSQPGPPNTEPGPPNVGVQPGPPDVGQQPGPPTSEKGLPEPHMSPGVTPGPPDTNPGPPTVEPGPPNAGVTPGPPETNPGPPDVNPGPPDVGVQPGPPTSEKALNFTKQGGKKGPLESWSWGLMGLMLVFICFLGGVFGPPEFMVLLMNFTIPADQLAELQCPSDQVIDPNQSEGNELPAVQKVEPSALSIILYEMLKSLNGLKSETEVVEFLPPNPCVIKGSLPTDPQPTPGAGGGTTGGGSSSTQPTEIAECSAGWLPASDCTCCGSTLVCADGSIGEFNPQCTGGGEATCTCVPNAAAATVGTGYHCRETGAACTP